MLETLRELYAHQAWADAVHWHRLAKFPGALDDVSIRERLHHIQVVQAAFLSLFRGQAPLTSELDSYDGMAELREDVMTTHDAAARFLEKLNAEELEREIDVPWFHDPPCRLPMRQAMLQVVSHSQYHRGQNATRLRELGGRPPTTDLIVWYWNGRPGPRWS